MRLLSWNLGRLHFGGRVNRWLGLDSRASDGDLPHVARVIARSTADVVAVQELRSAAQLERLRALLGDGWRAASPAHETADRRVGLLSRRELLPEFSSVAMGATGRFAQTAAVTIDGQRCAIASVHLDAYDARARAVQARALEEWAGSRGETVVVLAGDFNLDADEETFRALAASLDDLGAAAGATAILGRRVDYVLSRGDLAGRVRVLRGRRVRLGDHDPLFVSLTFAALSTARARSSR